MVDGYGNHNFELCCKILTQAEIDFTVTKNSFGNQITLHELQSITFVRGKESFIDQVLFYSANHGLLLIDNVDIYFNNKEVKQILERQKRHQQIVFSCDKGNLGWRHLEYNRGEVATHPKTGDLIAREYSWDESLIYWKHKDLKRHYATKASEEFYKSCLEFV